MFLFQNWIGASWHYLQTVYAKQQCIYHPITAGTVVFSSGPPAVDFLSPHADALMGAIANRVQWGPGMRACTVFLGERRAANSTRRLINLEVGVSSLTGRIADLTFEKQVVEMGIHGGVQRESTDLPYVNPTPALSPVTPEIVIQAAPADAIDRSHITFKCSLFQQTYLFDGFLKDDGAFYLNSTRVASVAGATKK